MSIQMSVMWLLPILVAQVAPSWSASQTIHMLPGSNSEARRSNNSPWFLPVQWKEHVEPETALALAKASAPMAEVRNCAEEPAPTACTKQFPEFTPLRQATFCA